MNHTSTTHQPHINYLRPFRHHIANHSHYLLKKSLQAQPMYMKKGIRFFCTAL